MVAKWKSKKRKPRTATHRRVNKKLAQFGKFCEWWDGGYPECFLPWGHPNESGCHGNPFNCKKLYLKYLASVKNPDPKVVENFESRYRSSEK